MAGEESEFYLKLFKNVSESKGAGLRNRVKPWKKSAARKLRSKPTESESILWERLRKKQLGVGFRRQVVILGWIVDFYCPSKKLVIEVDGGYHKRRCWTDARRDKILLEERDIRTLRIKSPRIFYNLESVIKEIEDFIQ